MTAARRYALFVPILAALAGYGIVHATKQSQTQAPFFSSANQEARWGRSYFPNLPVVDQDGRTFRFYDDLVKGKKVIINFVFTSCSAICPLTMARMAQLHDKLEDIAGKDVHFYSITVDPEHDGPTELKRYADAMKLGADWKLLTGKPEEIQIIRDKLGERSRMKSEHRHEMLIGNDVIGDWSKDSAYGDLDRVVINIRSMDPEWKMTENVVNVSTRPVDADLIELRDVPGEALFIKACASCHSIGRGDRIGPDLNGVTQRRDWAWLKKIISRPDLVLASNDSITEELKARFPIVAMPNLGLSEEDAIDVLAYIRSRSDGSAIQR